MKKTSALDISNLRKAAYAVRSGKTGCPEIAASVGWSVSKAHGVLRHLAKTGVLSSYRAGRGYAWKYEVVAGNLDEAIAKAAKNETPLCDGERWQVAALSAAWGVQAIRPPKGRRVILLSAGDEKLGRPKSAKMPAKAPETAQERTHG